MDETTDETATATDETWTYADAWRDAINQTYEEEVFQLSDDDLQDGEDELAATRRILSKAAEALRNGVPATFTGHELDLVRHLMPAHEVHQSGSTRWVLDKYGPED